VPSAEDVRADGVGAHTAAVGERSLVARRRCAEVCMHTVRAGHAQRFLQPIDPVGGADVV